MDKKNEIELKIGEPLPYAIVLKGGQIRFPAGHKVTRDILRMLREGQITQIEIDWSVKSDDTPGLFDEKQPDYPDSIHLKNVYLMKRSREIIASISEPFQKPLSILHDSLKRLWIDPTDKIDLDAITTQVDVLLNSISRSNRVPACIGWNAKTDDFFAAHMVDTLMLSTWLGFRLNLSGKEIRSLATAGILHDIGELFINRQILLRNTTLDSSEMGRIKEHPRKSVEWMKRAGINDELSHRIVLRHHERLDGSGYPFNIRGKILAPIDSIFAFADVFTALVSTRPYRSAITRRLALKLILEQKGKWFSDEIINELASIIGFYPPGSLVQLRNGDYVMIIGPPASSSWEGIKIDLEDPGHNFEAMNLLALQNDYIIREIAFC